MNREKWIKLLKNGGIFLAVLVITFCLLFKDKNMGSVLKVAVGVNPVFLVAAILCMSTFVCCEGLNIRRSLKMYGYSISVYRGIRYAFVGFFFSSITPSASGGQPMQVYDMHKDRIEISHSILALMIEFCSFQLIAISAGVIGFFGNIEYFTANISGWVYVLAAGVLVNTVILAVLLLAIFSKRIPGAVVNFITKVLKKFGYKGWEKFQKHASEQILLYRQGAQTLKKNKGMVGKILLTTLVQVLAYHSIPFLIYRSFGFSEIPWFTFFATQAVLYITISAVPLPGGVGAGESGFLLLFAALFPLGFVDSAMLLSRGISFYLFLVISGIFLVLGKKARSAHKVKAVQGQVCSPRPDSGEIIL